MTETTIYAPKLNNYQLYKEYRILWRIKNKDKVNEQARQCYIKAIETKPEFREILNTRTKNRKKKQIEADGGVVRTSIGRPRKVAVPKIPKANGRPRKYGLKDVVCTFSSPMPDWFKTIPGHAS